MIFRLIYIAVLVINAASCGKSSSGDPAPVEDDADDTDDQDDEDADAVPADDSGGDTDTNTDGDDDPDAELGCPQFPLVFHHGFMGSKKMGAFVGVTEQFQKRGCKVLVTEVAAVQTSEYRGAQLKTQIEAFLAETGAAKVHVIAHSQGGLDARYAISKLGMADKVASLSTLSTPHHGTKLADMALNTKLPLAKNAMIAMIDMMGKSMGGSTPDPDTLAAIKSMSVEYMEGTFNPDVQDQPGVLYQSWAAKSGQGTGDQLKTTLKLSAMILTLSSGDNDGVVPTKSGEWGDFKGVLIADHLDLIGMQMLDSPAPFNHRKFLDELVSDLKEKGL